MSDTTTQSPLDAEQRQLLDALLDCLVPPHAGVPGAGEAGVASAVEADARNDGEFATTLARGLDALDRRAREGGIGDTQGGGFLALAPEARLALLKEFSEAEPGFLPGILPRTYLAYYMDRNVLKALGLADRPPHPEGHPVEPNDLSLLEAVRERGKIYREC